jgi:hypothetical protein
LVYYLFTLKIEIIMTIIERIQAPTPKLFKWFRNVGLALATVSGVVLTSPVSLPILVVTIAGYAAVAGAVLTAVSQITVDLPAHSDNGMLVPEVPMPPVGPTLDIDPVASLAPEPGVDLLKGDDAEGAVVPEVDTLGGEGDYDPA